MLKNIVVGVTGGIAAYKACDIVSSLKKQGFEVDVIMTKHAQHFVQPLTFQTLSHNKTVTDMFCEPTRWDVEHIELAKKAELFLVAPATANIIGKIANGIADDMLTTTILATKAKVIFAPAMNTAMYENIAVQENIAKLKSRGYAFIEPAEGLLACGDVGRGKMEEPKKIVERILFEANLTRELEGYKVVITAGPTIEDLDPVRFVSNRSTGKMGYAIAQEAAKMGANVVLISGEARLEVPFGLQKFVSVRSAQDMFLAVEKEFEDTDILIKAAAVADFTPSTVADKKIKKKEGNLIIEMNRTKDIAYEMGRKKKERQVMVGFAAETNEVLENASAKLAKKNLDFIVSNDLTKEGAGFGTDTNIVTFLFSDGTMQRTELLSKKEVARLLLQKAGELRKNKKCR